MSDDQPKGVVSDDRPTALPRPARPMIRAVDLVAVGAVALVLLLPKPSLEAQTALVGDPIELDRIAEMEDGSYAEPESVDRAVALADGYLRLLHPDWALASLARFPDRYDYRIHLVRATAHAERLEAQAAVDETKLGYAACDREGAARCPAEARIKLLVIANPMQALLDGKIDPRKDPRAARDAVLQVLHATKASPTMSLKPRK